MKKHIRTNAGIFPVYISPIQGGRNAATILYHNFEKPNPNVPEDMGTYSFKHHIEQGGSENQAAEEMANWCIRTFGSPAKWIE